VLECNPNLGPYYAWIDNHGGARAIDLCGIVQWSFDIVVIDDCAGSFFQTVYFIATDNCGNQATTTADFSMDDNTPPVITQQAQDTIIECSAANQEAIITHWLNRQGGAQAYDACDPFFSWTNNYSGFNLECGGSGSAEVTFNAIDACLNISSTTVTLRIEDSTGPVILQQAKDIVIDCEDVDQDSVIQVWLDNHADAIVSDQCGTLVWSHDLTTMPDSCLAPFSQLVTFTVIDECLNGTTLDASITFVDTIIPKPVGFLDSSYQWTEHIAFGNWSQTFSHTISSTPTVFSDTTYYELLKSEDESPATWQNTALFLRLQDRIVYVREYNRENILYDYNLLENDTFFGYNDVPLIVDSIDTYYLLNGEPRSRILLRCYEDQPGTEFYTEWVEGIGNLQGLFAQNQYCQIDGSGINMLCMNRNDTLIYDSPIFESCWLLPTALNELNEGLISIYPNPVSETLTVDFGKEISNPLQIILTDVVGMVYLKNTLPPQIVTIPVNRFSPGIYFIYLETELGFITKKLIIE
nr:T9SS type A sorting domain-containing protein [Bacteroidota bacterium]